MVLPALNSLPASTLASPQSILLHCHQIPSPCTFQSPCPRALSLEPLTGLCPPCLPCSRHADLFSRPLIPQTTGVLLQGFCKYYSPRMLFFFAWPAPYLPEISGRSSQRDPLWLPYLKQIPLSTRVGLGSGSEVDRYIGWIISQIGVGQVWYKVEDKVEGQLLSVIHQYFRFSPKSFSAHSIFLLFLLSLKYGFFSWKLVLYWDTYPRIENVIWSSQLSPPILGSWNYSTKLESVL